MPSIVHSNVNRASRDNYCASTILAIILDANDFAQEVLKLTLEFSRTMERQIMQVDRLLGASFNCSGQVGR